MSVKAVCPARSEEYSVADDRVGTTIRCKVCKTKFEVEEKLESQLVKNRKLKVEKEQRLAQRKAKLAQQTTWKVILIGIAVIVLLSIGLGAAMVPEFRQILARALFLLGLTCFILAWFGTLFHEEEPLLRMLIRYFPPAILITLVLHLDETWPFFLLAAGIKDLRDLLLPAQ